MIARGDLGVEIGVAEVPLLQKRIILAALEHGKPAITATQMLETMIGRPEPTRAEASDVANAILDGTSAVMLSAETAVGTYPVEAVETMARIARAVEPSLGYRHQLPSASEAPTVGRAMSNAACDLAEALGAKAILVPTFTGRTASAVARLRPRRPIVALTHVGVSLQHMAHRMGRHAARDPGVHGRRGSLAPLDRDGTRRGHRRDRRPGRADRRHRREHPGLDERHQGRHGLGRARHGRGGDRGPGGNLRRLVATSRGSGQRKRGTSACDRAPAAAARPVRRCAARARRIPLLPAALVVLRDEERPLPVEGRGRGAPRGEAPARPAACVLDERGGDSPRSAAHRLHQAGRAALHRQGDPGLAPRAHAYPPEGWMTSRSSSASSAGHRARSGA